MKVLSSQSSGMSYTKVKDEGFISSDCALDIFLFLLFHENVIISHCHLWMQHQITVGQIQTSQSWNIKEQLPLILF